MGGRGRRESFRRPRVANPAEESAGTPHRTSDGASGTGAMAKPRLA
jgi:hypothetical protein